MRFPEFARSFPDANKGLIPWNKGKTKKNNPSLARLSNVLKAKKEWNFSEWQKDRNKQPAISYKELLRNESLAELIGIILGDGNLNKHPRTENLRITCNSKDTGHINHISSLIAEVFYKTPSMRKRNEENAVSIDLYQCKISERLNIPCGDKIRNNVGIPLWIFSNKEYVLKCLKGLFETDGCFHEDRKNHTRCIEFKNNCRKLREDVYKSLVMFGFKPQFGSNYIRLAKKIEVYRFREAIDFRNYIAL